MLFTILMTIESEEERSFVEEIYHRYHSKMLAICMSILKNAADAEDAVTDTFLRIIDNVEKFTAVAQDQLPGLIAICTKNTALNFYKKNARQNAHETFSTHSEEEGTTVELIDYDAEIEQRVMDHEFILEVAEMIKRLPEEQQAVVALKYFYHYRNNEIADLLGISRNAVDSRLFRAKSTLRKMLEDRAGQ
ncbi:MAG: RNA polymerase sigma factor [Clostridia bacterium]|nr:RNA polymerase sigma factor [Clostridia bacterium]